jgi:hypothetical protein
MVVSMNITEKNVPQHGGMKIIIKNSSGEDEVIRKIANMQQFISIFSNTIDVDIISVDSLTGFILRITLPEDATPFRSDIFNEAGELMTAEEHKQPTTGRFVTEHILKCCIIQPYKDPQISEYTPKRRKGTCKKEEFVNEYKAQSFVYDTTMAYGGMPVCPDVYACLEFNLLEFREVFFPDSLSPGHAGLPSIGTDVFKDNLVFQYLLRQMEAVLPPVAGQPAFERKVGIIVMESIPQSYSPLMTLYNSLPPSSVSPAVYISNPVLGQRKKLFEQITERALVICVIMFYRSGFIPLDAHMGNWMYDVSQPFSQFKVRAIDFGRIFYRKGETDIKKIRKVITLYIRKFGGSGASLANMLNSFALLLNIEPHKITTSLEAGEQVGEYFTYLDRLIKRNQNGSILWHPINPKNRYLIVVKPATATHPQRTMEIDSCMIIIHSIIFLIALVDSCYNSVCLQNHHFCQLRNIFSVLFGIKCNNLTEIIRHGVSINLEEYLNSMPDYNERIHIILIYERIRDYIREYLHVSDERGLFQDAFLEEIPPDSPEDPAVVAIRPPPPSPPIPPPPPPIPPPPPPPIPPPPPPMPSVPRISPSSPKPPLRNSPRLVVAAADAAFSSSGGSNKHYRKQIIKKSRKNKLSHILKTKKNKNHNRYRRNKRYRL